MSSLATLVLAASLALTGYLSEKCPDPVKPADTNVEMKAQASDKESCLRELMNRELDRFLVPLKTQDPADFQRWMKTQADFNRWVALACPASDEVGFWEIETRIFDPGTALGLDTLACRQATFGQRAFFAAGYAARTPVPFVSVVDASARVGARSQRRWRQILAKARTSHATSDTDAKQWRSLLGRLKEIAPKTHALAREQCANLPRTHPLAGRKCVHRVELWLFSLIPPNDVEDG